MSDRRAEVAENLTQVRARISAAAFQAGRSAQDVSLIVVTKHFPASDIEILASLGVRDVGENRHQEAQAKAGATDGLDVRWHFVGNLQSNKAAAVAGYAHVIESLDRAKLVHGLARGASEANKTLDCLLQVNLDEPEVDAGGRGGARPTDIVPLAEQVMAAEGLRLRGVMAVAPRGQRPLAAFEKLVEVAAKVRRVDPTATWISAGMSGDLEEAISAGATHVRIGSAVLGQRPQIK